MWHYLYPISYVCLLGTAAAWFFLKERDETATWAGRGVFLSFLTYGFSFFLEEGISIFGLLGLLTPDLAIFAAVVLIFNRFAKKEKFAYFMIFALIAGAKVFLFDLGREKASQLFSIENIANDTKNNRENITSKNNEIFENGELLLDVKNVATAPDALKSVISKYNLEMYLAFENIKSADNTVLDDYFVVNIPNENLPFIEKIIADLLETGEVDNIERNEVIRLAPVRTSETENLVKTNVNDPEASKLWGMDAMHLNVLHEFLKNNADAKNPHQKIKIAILDTGVEAEHEDLKGVYNSTKAEYDYDKMGHGTHCAGIASAVSNNGIGIASFAPNANFIEVTSVKVLSDQGWGTQEDIIQGIITAADNGAHVISMSLGGPSDDSKQAAYEEAVRYANDKGAIVVVAAGNSDDNAKDYSPANVKGVIAVAAIDNTIDKADFSNYVNDIEMAVAAPGVNIYSTFIQNEYKYLSGTSMATPYVAGLLGMMKWIKPDLTTKEAFEILKETGVNTKNTAKTGKLIQAEACLFLAKQP